MRLTPRFRRRRPPITPGQAIALAESAAIMAASFTLTDPGPEPPKLHPTAAAELAGIEREAVRLNALLLADRLAELTASDGTCEVAAAGLGLCESCQTEADVLHFLYGIARGEHNA